MQFWLKVLKVCNQATGYASPHFWCLFQVRINWEGCARKGIQRKNGGYGRDGAPISLDVVAVYPDCWCVCLCYLHFAPENPEDGEMYLLVSAHPVYFGLSAESCKMVVCMCVSENLQWWNDLGNHLWSFKIYYYYIVYSRKCFSIAGPHLWIALPSSLRQDIIS